MRIAILAVLLMSALAGCAPHKTVRAQAKGKRIIVLGIDGMDPGFVQRHWAELPNLNRLRGQGSFQELETTMPPESPVAWSTVTTGLEPDQHGIYGFVHRDPKTAMPISSMAETLPPDRFLSIGPFRIPLSAGGVRSYRRGRTFWELLAEHDVPATVLRMPVNFPPVECEALSLSGMGTPDLLGTFGTFSYYTDEAEEGGEEQVPGGRIVGVRLDNYQVDLAIAGPDNTLREDRRPTSATMKVSVDPEQPAAGFELQGSRFVLNQGEWSDWVHVRFPLLGPLAAAHGMVRVYAKQLKPRFQVYVSPVNIDPGRPDLPISNPGAYSAELARSVGDFYTQGMAEDTSALRRGVLTRQEYLAQAALVHKEHLAILRHELGRFHEGVLFFHFFGIDQNSHMLWGRHDDELLETYQLVDRTVGEVMDRAPDATLIVMSDHGFTSFDRAVNLNAWLAREGFLALTDPKLAGDQEVFANVDWSRTKAYAVGLTTLYVNLHGREARGIVHPVERPRLLDQMAERLLEFRDPKTGARVVDRVYRTDPDWPETAPGLLVGYAPPYRASWQTVLGAVPADLIEENEDAWIGDHCISSRFVPGLLITNRKTIVEAPKLADLPLTLLHEYGVPPAEGMKGRPLF